MRILVDGPIAGSYSLAVVNRQFSEALIELGLDVYLTQREGPNPLEDAHFAAHSHLKKRYIPYKDIGNHLFDVHTKNDWPVFSEPRCGSLLVSHCYAWEETIFPPHVMMQLDRFDAIFTTSKFTEDALVYSGFIGRVQTIGNGVNHLLSASKSEPSLRSVRRDEDTFTFLHISSGLLRKGIDIGIKAFIAEFADEDKVRLRIKTHPSETNTIYSCLSSLSAKERSKIDLIDTDMSTSEIVELIKDADFCFFPSRGEGFLLPAAEAMLLNTPVCVTACGGNAEFCNSETAIIIPTYISQSKSHISNGSAAWFDFDEADVKKALREARSMQSEALAAMTSAAHKKIKQFTWSTVAKKFVVAIEDLISEQSIASNIDFQSNEKLLLMSTYNQKCGVATYSSYISDAFAVYRSPIKILAEDVSSDKLTSPDDDQVIRVWTRDQNLKHKVVNSLKAMESVDHLLIQYHPGFFSWKDLGSLVLEVKKYTKTVTVELHSTDGHVSDIKYFLDRLAGSNIIVHNGSDYTKIVSCLRRYQNVYLIPHPTIELGHNMTMGNASTGKNDIKIFSFGICWPHKQFEKIIEAVRFLKNRGHNVSATIVTSIVDTDYRSVSYAHDLQVYKELLNLSDEIQIVNEFLPSDEVIALAQKSSIAFFPYKEVNEGASGAVRVALASNIPVLISNSTIFEDIVHICKVCDVEDVLQVSKNVLELASHPQPALAVQTVYKEYTSWSKYVKRIRRIVNNEVSR